MEFVLSHVCFTDTMLALKNEFKDDKTNTLIILGAQGFSKNPEQNIKQYKVKYNKVIVFNQEPLGAKQRDFFHDAYKEWIKGADEVWDYDEENLKILKTIRPDAKLHVLKPFKVWPKAAKKDIDILFYGSINEHRRKLLDALKKKYNVVEIVSWNADELDSYILRSKILLNIHYYNECSLQEQARLIKWIGAPCRIISEKSVHNYLNVEEKTYEELFNL